MQKKKHTDNSDKNYDTCKSNAAAQLSLPSDMIVVGMHKSFEVQMCQTTGDTLCSVVLQHIPVQQLMRNGSSLKL